MTVVVILQLIIKNSIWRELYIHKTYLETGIKYELKETEKNKLYYNEKNMELHKKYFSTEKD